MKNFKMSGDVVTITATADVKSGDFIKIGELKGFAQTDAADGTPVALVTRCVQGVTCDAPAGVTVGQPIFWTGTDFTTSMDDGGVLSYEYVAIAVSAAAAGAAVEIDVKI